MRETAARTGGLGSRAREDCEVVPGELEVAVVLERSAGLAPSPARGRRRARSVSASASAAYRPWAATSAGVASRATVRVASRRAAVATPAITPTASSAATTSSEPARRSPGVVVSQRRIGIPWTRRCLAAARREEAASDVGTHRPPFLTWRPVPDVRLHYRHVPSVVSPGHPRHAFDDQTSLAARLGRNCSEVSGRIRFGLVRWIRAATPISGEGERWRSWRSTTSPGRTRSSSRRRSPRRAPRPSCSDATRTPTSPSTTTRCRAGISSCAW